MKSNYLVSEMIFNALHFIKLREDLIELLANRSSQFFIINHYVIFGKFRELTDIAKDPILPVVIYFIIQSLLSAYILRNKTKQEYN